VYCFARKRLAVLPAAVAVLLLSLSPFRAFALEARSYALLVGFVAISLCLWQRAEDKRYMTPLLGLFLMLAVACHHLAVIVLGCFGAAELAWSFVTRRVRRGCGPLSWWRHLPFAVSVPLLIRYREIYGNTFWAPSQWWGSRPPIGSIWV